MPWVVGDDVVVDMQSPGAQTTKRWWRCDPVLAKGDLSEGLRVISDREATKSRICGIFPDAHSGQTDRIPWWLTEMCFVTAASLTARPRCCARLGYYPEQDFEDQP
jgi:hypothetical protein